MRKVVPRLLKNTEKSYYRWKEEGRPIIKFLEQFTITELEEFLDTGKMESFEEFRAFKASKDNDPEFQQFKKVLKFKAWEQWEEFQKTQNS